MMHSSRRKTTHPGRAIAIAAMGIIASIATALADKPNDARVDSHNLKWLGTRMLQGRTAYQPTLHTINGHVYLPVGHFSGGIRVEPAHRVVGLTVRRSPM